MILFADTFNTYGTDTNLMLDGLYALTFNVSLDLDPAGSGTHVLRAATSALTGYLTRRVFPALRTTVGAGFRLWLDGLPPTTSHIPAFVFLDGSNGQQVAFTVDVIGRIVAHTGSGGGAQIGITSGPVVTANAWNHIEVKAVASLTVGSVEVRVNGVPVLTVAGVNTGTGYFQFALENPASAINYNYYIKDLVVWDSTGTYNTNFLGSVNVIDLLPDADVVFPWTPSSGATGFNLISDLPPSDASYIAAGFPAPAASLFSVQNLPADVTSVKAAIVCVRSEKIDGGDGNIQAGLKSGASTGLGTDRPVTVAFTYYQDLFEVDPATAAPWSPTAINNVQLQLNRTV
jgi:hypothetical protein